MATFTAGQTLTLTLDYDDVVSIQGQGIATITPSSGSVFTTYLTGSQQLGPYGKAVTISIVTSTGGTYTQSSQPGVVQYSSEGAKTQNGSVLPLGGFIPPTNDYAGIMSACNAAVAAGGGIVQLLPVVYEVGGNTIPLYSNVLYKGSGVGYDQNNVLSATNTGTQIHGDGTAILFGYNTADLNPWSASACSISGTTLTVGGSVLVNGVSVAAAATTFVAGTAVTGPNVRGNTFILSGSGTTYTINNSQTVSVAQAMSGNSPYANAGLLKASLSIGGGVVDLGVSNGSYGIKCGALYQGGGNNFKIDNIVASNCTQWGVWLENHNTPIIGTVRATGCGVGQIWLGASGGSYQNYGDGTVEALFFQVTAGYSTFTSRGAVIESRGYGTAFNDMIFNFIGGNHQTGNTLRADTAVFNGTTATIGVSAVQNYALDTGVTFSTSLGSNITANLVYFITDKTGTSGAGTIQVSLAKGGTPIVCSSSGSITINTRGAQLLELGGRGDNQSSYTTGMVVSHTDLEIAGTFTTLLQNCTGTKFSIDASYSNTGLVLRQMDTGSGSSSQIHSGWGCLVDADAPSRMAQYFGIKPTFVTNGNSLCGMMYDSIANTMVLRLNTFGGGTDDITMPNNTWKAINMNSMLKLFYGEASGGWASNYGNVLTVSPAGTATSLPTINADMLGIPFYISNPSASTVTLSTSSGQLIDGVAAATSIVMPINSTAMFIAQRSGGTFYWARYK